MKEFKDLTLKQKQDLLKFPAYISLLASSDAVMDETERLVAINLAHTKAFSCQPLLEDYCKESEIIFEENLKQLEASLPKDKESRDVAIRKEMAILEKTLARLGKEYVSAMHHSLKSFKEHVLKAHHSVIIDFLIPIPVPGLTD